MFSLFSLFQVGIVTTLLGGIAGGLMAGSQVNFQSQERWTAVL
jgi:hypothetical protein